MADLAIRIKADTASASKAFNDLAVESEYLQGKIKKLGEDMGTKEAERFIEKQNLAGVAMRAVGKDVEGLSKQHTAYEKEIQRLVNKGVDPASGAIAKLRKEQEILNKELAKSGVYTGDAAKGVEFIGNAANVAAKLTAALGVAVVAMTQKTAEMGDAAAKTARSIGMTAESFQELEYAAKQSGVDDLGGSLQKLNKNMSDLRRGSGSLVTALKGTNNELLHQLNSAKSNEEAFDLLMKAIKNAPDEFTRAEIATAAFGKAGHGMINMAMEGADGIAALREEARNYGIISNESASNSEKFLDAQTRIKKTLEGVQIQLTEKLLPIFTNIIDKVTEFITNIDNWDRVLKMVTITLGVVTGLLTGFMIIVKGAAMITAFSKAVLVLSGAFKALNIAMAANPVGAIVAAIAVAITLLIAGITALIKNWDMVQTYLQQGIARLEYAFKWLGSVIKESFLVAFSVVKAAGATLVDFYYGNIIRAIGTLLEVMGKIPGEVGEPFRKASRAVGSFGESMGEMAANARSAVGETIEAARIERQETQETLKAKLDAADEAARVRRDELREKKRQNDEEMELARQGAQAEIAIIEAAEQAKTAVILGSLKERLDLVKLTENQIHNENIKTLQSFLQQQADMEGVFGQERIDYMNELHRQMLADKIIHDEERLALETALQNEITKIQEDAARRERELLEQRMGALNQFFSGFGALMQIVGEKNRKAAVAAKAMAMAEAAIQTYLAASKALASAPPPINFVSMAGVLAAGVAQQISIARTPIPSAETGGRFMVPGSSPRVDSTLMRVNPGEVAEIMPRGMAGESGTPINLYFNFNGTTFAKIMNFLAKSGEMYNFQLSERLA